MLQASKSFRPKTFTRDEKPGYVQRVCSLSSNLGGWLVGENVKSHLNARGSPGLVVKEGDSCS